MALKLKAVSDLAVVDFSSRNVRNFTNQSLFFLFYWCDIHSGFFLRDVLLRTNFTLQVDCLPHPINVVFRYYL